MHHVMYETNFPPLGYYGGIGETETTPSQLCINCAGKLDGSTSSDLVIDPGRSPFFELLETPNILQSLCLDTPLMVEHFSDSYGTSWPVFKPPAPTYAATDLLPSDDSGPGALEWIHSYAHSTSSSPAAIASSAERPPSPGLPPPLAGETVPQRLYKRREGQGLNRHIGSIIFATEQGDGFPVKDALDRHYTGLKERDDEVLLGGGSSISLRLEWPGYPSWSRQIKTRDWRKNPRPITLSKLATEIAKTLNLFIREMDSHSSEPAENLWKVGAVGSNCINVNIIALVALEHASRASWQPVFRLLTSA